MSVELEARGISKMFGHVQALSGASLTLRPGRICALVGDNGAGKSTLIKILSGVYRPDAGQLYVDGEPTLFADPSAARAAGVATVYQDLALAETRDASANIFLGREFRKYGIFVDRRKCDEEARVLLKRLNTTIGSVRVAVRDLSGGQRQAVAIARALAQGARAIVLDEPTAALGVPESQRVLDLTRELRDSGVAVLLVSHNLQHVFEVADDLVVLHQGIVVGTFERDETTIEEVIRLITFGR